MGFGQAIQSCFSNYVNFSGRAPRSEAAYWLLFNMLVGISASIIDAAVWGSEAFDSEQVSLSANTISSLVLFLPGVSVGVRRLHDIGKSGWNMLWAFTIIGLFPLLYWTYFKPGDEGDNEYGPNPLFEGHEVAKTPAQDGQTISPIHQTASVEEELNKLKKMLDDGLIDQSDYDAKKQELLGL